MFHSDQGKCMGNHKQKIQHHCIQNQRMIQKRGKNSSFQQSLGRSGPPASGAIHPKDQYKHTWNLRQSVQPPQLQYYGSPKKEPKQNTTYDVELFFNTILFPHIKIELHIHLLQCIGILLEIIHQRSHSLIHSEVDHRIIDRTCHTENHCDN